MKDLPIESIINSIMESVYRFKCEYNYRGNCTVYVNTDTYLRILKGLSDTYHFCSDSCTIDRNIKIYGNTIAIAPDLKDGEYSIAFETLKFI